MSGLRGGAGGQAGELFQLADDGVEMDGEPLAAAGDLVRASQGMPGRIRFSSSPTMMMTDNGSPKREPPGTVPEAAPAVADFRFDVVIDAS